MAHTRRCLASLCKCRSTCEPRAEVNKKIGCKVMPKPDLLFDRVSLVFDGLAAAARRHLGKPAADKRVALLETER